MTVSHMNESPSFRGVKHKNSVEIRRMFGQLEFLKAADLPQCDFGNAFSFLLSPFRKSKGSGECHMIFVINCTALKAK